MNKNIKQQLKENQEKNHEEFRQQLVQDVYQVFKKWNSHLEGQMEKREKALKDLDQELSQTRDEIKQAHKTLRTIKGETIKEVQALKRGRTWKFYLNCFLFGLIGSLTGTTLWAIYWETIVSIFT